MEFSDIYYNDSSYSDKYSGVLDRINEDLRKVSSKIGNDKKIGSYFSGFYRFKQSMLVFFFNKISIFSCWFQLEILIKSLKPDIILLDPMATTFSVPFLKYKIPIINLYTSLYSGFNKNFPPTSDIMPVKEPSIGSKITYVFEYVKYYKLRYILSLKEKTLTIGINSLLRRKYKNFVPCKTLKQELRKYTKDIMIGDINL